MGTGQTLLTIGAMSILTMMLLRINASYLSTDTILLDNKTKIFAVSVATSIIEEANKLSFDEQTIEASVTAETSLSSNLGKETGEVYPDFDDFDDYNYFKTNPKIDEVEIDPNFPKLTFQSNCRVDYVNSTQPNTSITTKTWHKKLTVYVTSPTLLKEDGITQDTVVMSTIFSYWYFR